MGDHPVEMLQGLRTIYPPPFFLSYSSSSSLVTGVTAVPQEEEEEGSIRKTFSTRLFTPLLLLLLPYLTAFPRLHSPFDYKLSRI